jgi:hypothetical protein
MAGSKRRMLLSEPEELRRRYGDNATAAASIMGSVRRDTSVLLAVVGAVGLALGVPSGGASPSGWAVAMAGLAAAGACVVLTAIIFYKAKRIASLRTARS